jgi:hypothetical protein
MTEIDIKWLNTWDRKTPRRIYRPVVEQRIWRIRSNQELQGLYKDLDMVTDIKNTRLEWIGHLVRKYLRVNQREEKEWKDLH